MKAVAALLLVATPVMLCAQKGEDAVHRADREKTERLNRDAAAVVARRDKSNARALDRYQNAREAYETEMAAWRTRVADCRAGK
jgi:hypothetical protein